MATMVQHTMQLMRVSPIISICHHYFALSAETEKFPAAMLLSKSEATAIIDAKTQVLTPFWWKHCVGGRAV